MENLTTPIQFSQVELATLYTAITKRLFQLASGEITPLVREEQKILREIREKVLIRL